MRRLKQQGFIDGRALAAYFGGLLLAAFVAGGAVAIVLWELVQFLWRHISWT